MKQLRYYLISIAIYEGALQLYLMCRTLKELYSDFKIGEPTRYS